MKIAQRFWQIVVGIVKELSDESAYQRHLLAAGKTHSPAEWRTFSDARLRRKYERAKCC